MAVRSADITDNLTGISYPKGSLIPFAACFTSPPNILDALRMPLDPFCACIHTDNTGAIRTPQLKDPSNPVGRTVLCNFNDTNMLRPISVIDDNPSNLTTLMGARRNQSVYTASDFVTDQAIVSSDRKARYMRTSQYQITSSQTPAGQYSYAIGAPVFDSVLDIPADAQIAIDSIVGIWSPQIYSDGTSSTGKRRNVQFTAFFDDPAKVGATTTCALESIMFGKIVQINYPAHGLSNVYGAVLAWEIFPFAQKIVLTCLV